MRANERQSGESWLSSQAEGQLMRAFQKLADGSHELAALHFALGLICRDAHASGRRAEEVVVEFRRLWRRIDARHLDAAAWDQEYERALSACLSVYFS
jgi:hypothetical protein